jgi:hypothetical protein
MNRTTSIFIVTATAFVLTVGVVAGMHFAPEKIVYTETEVVNDSLWVSKSLYIAEKALAEQLSTANEAMKEELERTNGRLAEVININARLRLNPRVVEVERVVYIDRNVPVDTTFTDVYGDSLLAAHARLQISEDKLTYSHDLVQLRPLNVQIITVDVSDGTNVYVQSNDFELVEINSFVARKQPRYKWYQIFGAGVLSGVIVWELIR